jgi:hypothetical protein
VVYLGHVITGEGLSPTNNNVQKLLEMRPPRNKDDIRSVLGSAGYYRRFVPNFASVLEPMVRLLSKNSSSLSFLFCPQDLEDVDIDLYFSPSYYKPYHLKMSKPTVCV